MKRPTGLSLLCGLAVLFGSVTCDHAANEKNAKELIEAQGKTILRAAHPLGKFKSLTCDGSRKTDSGYDLTYTIGWTGTKKQEYHTTLLFGFAFNRQGEIDEIKITAKSDSSSVAPLKLSKVAMVGLKVVLKSQLKKYLPKDVAKELCKEVDRMGDAKDLLAFWLKHVGNKDIGNKDSSNKKAWY